MKITRSTVKSFINKNRSNLYINNKSSFDGMIDGLRDFNCSFEPIHATSENYSSDYNLGIAGLWLVGQSRDSFDSYNDGKFKGIEIYNSCGHSIIAVKV